MNGRTDQELLLEYAGSGAEVAFSEIVRRHVDFVYSAALRVIGNVQLAEEVSQKVFLALAQNARRLADRAVLSGWLFCTAHNLSVNAVRSEERRRAREEKAAAMNELLAGEHEAVWESIAPHLDDALSQLSQPDRDAVLLRYFERKSAREMAQALGISGEAAQKRVNRAIERLRALFAKRGIAVGANGLVLLIGANAVKAAPAGLALSICAAAVSGVAVQTSVAITTTKIIAMTTLQKALVASALVALVGTGTYKARESALRREQVQALQQNAATAQSGLPRGAPDASNLSAGNRRTGARGLQAQGVARPASKRAGAPVGFQSTEMYALLTNKVSRLTRAQVEPYLKSKGRDAASLLAAFRTTGDLALLAEARRKFPNDPEVGFETAIRNDASRAERRAGLDAFKRGAPENALANYLSALDLFKSGQKGAAVQELNAGATKQQFQDYTLERTRTDEQVYRTAGYAPGEAQMIANCFLPEAHLVQMNELGQSIVALAAGYGQSGDRTSQEAALQMALTLGRRFDDPAAGETMRWQLIGIRIERAALNAMDPARMIDGQSVRERLAQIAQQKEAIQELTRQADPIWKTLSDDDWTSYHAQIARTGEEAAVRWLVSNYGQR
jgi:RNA polymerase sigma factor (sigma-70 family)